jgi:O-antigen ligase
MARRSAKSSARDEPGPRPRPDVRPAPARGSADRDDGDPGHEASHTGERVRRFALGVTAALMTARAFWPSEPDLKEGAGSGMYWVLAVFVVFGLALADALIGGRFRFRWSWTDALVVGLTFLVALSALHAVDRRPALNLAWEWVGLGLMYLLLRNLPRTRNESSALAGSIVATAFAVSAYGLYQAKVELPLLQAEFERNPRQMLQRMNIEPGGRGEEMLRNRLMYSNEIWSTFALANSLAGFIAGPLVLALAVGFQNLVRRDAPESRWVALGMAAPVILVLLVCLILTKSRSAWTGLLVASIVLAWRARRQVPARELWAAGLAGLGVVTVLVFAGLASRRLDPEVLTQSPMSLRTRWEYWQGAWGVITGGATTLLSAVSSPIFWAGVGPGNFAGPYLKHKLPQASEEILDPHNLFLEVWATAGFWALLALVAALVWGVWNLLGPAARAEQGTDTGRTSRSRRRDSRWRSSSSVPDVLDHDQEVDGPPRRVTWLIACAGVGGWALVVILGDLNPFMGDLIFRWMILGASWMAAVFLGAPLWGRLPIPAEALGAAVLAILINLLAAGGIGIPTVALGLWSMLALGLNLRDDRWCSRLHEYESRVPPFALATGWAALLGTFVGMVAPFWRSEAAIAEALAAIEHHPPDFDRADTAYKNAIVADRYYARPWRELAYLHLLVWRQSGAKVDDRQSRWSWTTIPYLYQMAATPPRNLNAWTVHSERSRVIHQLLSLVGSKLDPLELVRYRGEMVKSTRTAVLLNPTSAELHGRLADASAEINMFQDAALEATEALRLDDVMPHKDKKLPEGVRKHLEALIPTWEQKAAKMPIHTTP